MCERLVDGFESGDLLRRARWGGRREPVALSLSLSGTARTKYRGPTQSRTLSRHCTGDRHRDRRIWNVAVELESARDDYFSSSAPSRAAFQIRRIASLCAREKAE